VTTRHPYPPSALLGDYLRCLAGIVLALPPLVFVATSRIVSLIFAALVALFVAFGSRTLLMQLRRIEMSDAGIEAGGPFPTRLDWAALEEMRLAYYATRRDGEGGWMQLMLRAGGRRLRLDSRIENFRAIVEQAAYAARRRRLALTATTKTNLAALGVVTGGAEEPWPSR
jgi:hypothetical protein